MSNKDAKPEPTDELRGYLWTFALCLLLTIPIFALVAWGNLDRPILGWIIGASALFQVVVHFRGFLHIRLNGQTREDLQLVLFTTLLLVLMAGGTLWILSNLEYRMHSVDPINMSESL